MDLARLQITNFRNLKEIDVPFSAGAVIVGENRAGKSNLLYALRLVLDPSLSSTQRTLAAEDFSDPLGPDPIGSGCEIKVSVDLTGFDGEEGVVAALSRGLISGEPMTARLTYRFGPREDRPGVYGWSIYGGDDPAKLFGNELRSVLHHVHMHALRDAAGDVASWRRSPLKPLLEELPGATDADELSAVGEALEQANTAVRGLESVKETAAAIASQTQLLVGQLHAIDPTLDLAPTNPERTLRSLRLYLDGSAQRTLSSGSLGSLNVLYIALQELELHRLILHGDIEHALISIEEPEAHLHPHLQRRMFRGLLEGDGPKRSTVVSTHSPHIVSVSDPKRLVLLRDVDGLTEVCAASAADLPEPAWEDLARYLDATRSEMVFARRVLLVEGFAEQLLLPLAAAPDTEFDEVGITVCAIHGTHFESYVRFLAALGTPYAVLTDGDPGAGTGRTGADRVARLLAALGAPDAAPDELGIFIGDTTLESDLFAASASNRDAMLGALRTFDWSQTKREGIVEGLDLLAYVKEAGKGRFAQRLAGSAETLEAPSYVAAALQHLLK